MKNTNWYRIESGQIVRFRYKNMKGESSNRTAYVLAPRYKYRKQSTGRVVEFFIGLEIENTQKQAINPVVLKQMFEEINDIFEDSEKSADYTDERVIRRIYENLKRFLNGTPIFRTYFLRECRRRRVFLVEDANDLIRGSLKQVVQLILEDKQDALERALPDED
jgi:hypothetical protein|tara:strand:- start:58 stop:549 length:492 start_codon:yes stop_codon:yes gene_type:complete